MSSLSNESFLKQLKDNARIKDLLRSEKLRDMLKQIVNNSIASSSSQHNVLKLIQDACLVNPELRELSLEIFHIGF